MNPTDTQRLAAASFELVSDARSRRLTTMTLLVVLAALALAAGLRLLADGAAATDERTRLQQQNSGLRAEVARLQAELELERATHAGLEAQVGELNKQLAELQRQSAFVNAQRARARGMASPN